MKIFIVSIIFLSALTKGYGQTFLNNQMSFANFLELGSELTSEEIQDLKKIRSKDLQEKKWRDHIHENPLLLYSLYNLNKDLKGISPNVRKYDHALAEKRQKLKKVESVASVMLLTQLLLTQKTKLHPALIAYGMLYPYTDDFIDNDELSILEKHQFTENINDLLNGENNLTFLGEDGGKIKSTFDLIKEMYPIPQNKNLYLFLQLLNNAQWNSLQQKVNLKNLSSLDPDINFQITRDKGSFSVIAAAYIANGDLNQEQEDFFSKWGLILQLIDDLDDFQEDFNSFTVTPVHFFYTDNKLERIFKIPLLQNKSLGAIPLLESEKNLDKFFIKVIKLINLTFAKAPESMKSIWTSGLLEKIRFMLVSELLNSVNHPGRNRYYSQEFLTKLSINNDIDDCQ